MRLGAVLADRKETPQARGAEFAGLFGVLAGFSHPRTSINAAVYAATATAAITIAIRIELGNEHPITISEELAVLDNVSSGRVVILADSGDLAPDRALEELEIIQHALASRSFAYGGQHFKVPAGISTNKPESSTINVTPKPAQIEIPIWAMGTSAHQLSTLGNLPILALTPADCDPTRPVQPGVTTLSGTVEEDRDRATAWAEAGATHLFLENPPPHEFDWDGIARYLVPEVAMPAYPRLVSDASPPLPWPQLNGKPTP
jgi:alkanesulfonate monooxygenase SsuD/methylene tetrahydromethanopterin reductase-like flavin-dependent oxidoreductase (luciferase family)